MADESQRDAPRPPAQKSPRARRRADETAKAARDDRGGAAGELEIGAASPAPGAPAGVPVDSEASAPEAAPPVPEGAPAMAGADGESFPIVGLGASAGGLAAVEQFCAAMPQQAESALALVIIQHLDPDRKSLLSDLVRQYTRMTVHEVTDGMRVRPGHAYIIPPNKDMALLNGRLRLLEPSNPRGLRLPIDYFFRSLAQDRREQAIAVILSGTGTDGTLGLKAIKEGGGLVIAQQPDSAQYDGMPRSAIATGLVDYILPPDAMAARLLAYAQHIYGPQPRLERSAEVGSRQSEPLQRIFTQLRSHTGHDFSRYKHNTILRRIERRMAVHQLETLEAYVRYLQQNPPELTILFRELLIGVTNFFRDPDAFGVLQERVIPAIVAGKRNGEAVRVWVPGCSTGEEAYSIAMLIQEHLSKLKLDARAQVFATDIDTEAIDQARAAVYPNSIAADVTPERLSRFFTEESSAYRIKKVIRDMVVFAEQNVVEDPPFSRMDLVSCRNLLIYMSGDLQRRVLPLFHYALNPQGYLLLGTSETVGEFTDLFTPLDRKWKIFVRKPGMLPQRAAVDFARANVTVEAPLRRNSREARSEARLDVRQVLEQALLAQHTPAAVVVNADGDVVYIHGRTGLYLEPAPGEASLNVLRMARDGLRLELTTALRKAISSQGAVEHKGLSIRANGGSQVIDLLVRPLIEAPPMAGLYLVLFQAAPVQETGAWEAPPIPPGDKDQRITNLERELRSKEEYLQTTIEELETSNEELTSTNEELQSANEELQSTNEELETSKEELQSVNEELMTVNMELQKKIEELSRVNNDLNNLLASTGIGTVFVDYQLRIQRFTPAATEIINLIQTDVGRPAAHIVSNLVGYSDLIRDVTSVLETLIPREREVQIRSGQWYLMRIQPYRTLENVIEGAVITFVDITAQKQMQAALDESQRLRLETVADPVIVVNLTGEVVDASQAALTMFGHDRARLLGLRVSEIAQAESVPLLLEALTSAERGANPNVEITLRGKDGERVDAEARMRRVDSGNNPSIFVVLRDITRRRAAEEALQKEVATHDRLASLMRDMRHPAIVFDWTGRILAWNVAAELAYGWPEGDVLGRSIEELIPEEFIAPHRAALAAAQTGRESGAFESERLTPAGEHIKVMVTSLALLDRSGAAYAVASIERPVSGLGVAQ